MARANERIDMQKVESHVLKFGPLTTQQVSKQFGVARHTSLTCKLKLVPTLKSIRSGKAGLVWYHINGVKPEGVTE